MSFESANLSSPPFRAFPGGRSESRLRLSTRSVSFSTAIGDFLLIFAAAATIPAAYHTAFLGGATDPMRYLVVGTICFLNFLAIGLARRTYQVDALINQPRQVQGVLLTWAAVALLSISLLFATKTSADLSRGATVAFLAAVPLALVGWRLILGSWAKKAVDAGALAPKQVILVADREQESQTDVLLRLRHAGYSASCSVTYSKRDSEADLNALADEVLRQVVDLGVDSIVLLADWNDSESIDRLGRALRVAPVSIYLLPDRRVARLVQNGTGSLGDIMVARVQRAPLSVAERTLKRAFDILFSGVALMLLAPVLAIVALLVRLDSPGPILFRQQRSGFGRRLFYVYKFRTMADASVPGEFRQAAREDVRVTRIGRWLRRTSIDELPQLWNVLIGDMSVVGPRPHPIALNEGYQAVIGGYAFRHHVKPGLTGWAQINGLRGETRTVLQMQRRIEHDLHYIDHWSFTLDLWIVLSSVRLVFHDPAAY